MIEIYENIANLYQTQKYAKYELCKNKLAKLENALIEKMLTAAG